MEVFPDNFATDDVLFAGQRVECDFDVAGIGGGEEDWVEDGGYEAKLQSKCLEEVTSFRNRKNQMDMAGLTRRPS